MFNIDYIDFKISQKTLVRFLGLFSILAVFIKLMNMYYDKNAILIISMFSFFIFIYFLLELTSNMSNESIKYDNRSLIKIEEDNIKQKMQLLNAAQNQIILDHASNFDSNLFEKLDSLEQIKVGYSKKLMETHSGYLKSNYDEFI